VDKIKVLIVDDERKTLDELKSGLEKYDLLVEGVQLNTDAIKILKSDARISVILLDYCLYTEHQQWQDPPIGDELIKKFREIKEDIPVFYITDKKEWKEICTDTKASGFFDKDELLQKKLISFEFVAGCLNNAAEEWRKSVTPAPFFDELKKYVDQYNYSWHTPGHAGGYSFKKSLWIKDFYDFFGEKLFRADLSVSVDELDSLLEPKEPEGVIAKAQNQAAKAFGAKRTFFVTNGTSTANKIVIQTLVQPGENLILDRNCHKSVHYAVILSGVKPVYLQPAVNRTYGIFGPVPMNTIKSTIDDHPDAKAIILTNCTYDGLVYDLKTVVGYAHSKGIKVIVDEAWFGYAYFHPSLRACSAMESGADYCTQSTHKVLSAFSQASMIHIKDPEFEDKYEHIFREHFCMHTSTSPQYPIIASLDVARKQMQLEGYTLLDEAIKISEQLKKAINEQNEFISLSKDEILKDFEPQIKDDGIYLDPTKLLIHTNNFNAKNVKKYLDKKGIKVEKKTFNTLLFLITIAITDTKAGTLLAVLNNFDGKEEPPSGGGLLPNKLPTSKMDPRDAFYKACKYGQSEWVELEKANNRISAGMVVPYPPGIPLLLPGEEVSVEIIECLKQIMYFDDEAEIHGLKVERKENDEKKEVKNRIWVMKT